VSAILSSTQNAPADEKAPSSENSARKEVWINAVMDTARGQPGARLELSRFKDPMWFLLRPIGWTPGPSDPVTTGRIEVPIGFVTDLASVPPIFFSLLRPDGEYAYPAILHDYLYWVQRTSRDEADTVFKVAMQDFGVEPFKIATIYTLCGCLAVTHGPRTGKPRQRENVEY
jgi:hypothetical protein